MAHRRSEGTQSAVRINRMLGKQKVSSAAERLPICTAKPLLFWVAPRSTLARRIAQALPTTKGAP
jgi:hypothetical protein